MEIGFFKAAIAKELILKASVLMPTFGQESAKPLELSSSNGKKRKLMPATSRSETMGCTYYREVKNKGVHSCCLAAMKFETRGFKQMAEMLWEIHGGVERLWHI